MLKNILSNVCLAVVILASGLIFSACGDSTLKNGTYEDAGVIYNVSNNSATITGVSESATEIVVPTEFKGVKVVGISDNALSGSSVTKVSFEQKDFKLLSLGEKVFSNSQVKTIENLPANVSMSENSLEGLKNLETISTYGVGEFSVVNNALIQTKDENTKYLRLLPANSQPQDNFNNGTYTVTGYNWVFDYAVEYNQFIKDLIICNDIQRIESYAFANINLDSITFADDVSKNDIFVDGTAFTAHKDLKIYVPAETQQELSSWLNYSKNYIYGHNWLVHPVGCTNEGQHCHGGRLGNTVPASYTGWRYSISGNKYTINANYTYISTIPNYMLKTYDEIVAE